MMTVSKARRNAAEVEALTVDLDLADAGFEVCNDPRVQVAARLRPAPAIREAARDDAKARMLRAFDAADPKATADAGSRDHQGPQGPDVHTARIELEDGTRVVAADLERIDADKAARVAAAIAASKLTRRTGRRR